MKKMESSRIVAVNIAISSVTHGAPAAGKPAQKHRKDQKQPDFHGFYQLAAVPRKKQGIEIGVALQMHKAPNFFLIRFQILFLDSNIGKRA